MARLGRGYPVRPVTARQLYRLDATVTLAAFESVSEWPALTIDTPSADIFLPAFESVSEWPALTLAFDQAFALPVFESVSEWPALSLDTPILPGANITAAGQVEWNGTLWGEGTSFRLRQIDGWRSLPSVSNLNVERPSRHGAWAGRKLGQQRIVTIRLQVNSITDETLIDDLLDDLDAVTGLGEDETELPLVVKGYGAPLLAYGSIIDRDVPMDGDWSVGAANVSILIACSDPRLYSLERHGATIPPGTPTGLANTGNTATHPLIRMEGPVVDPVLTRAVPGATNRVIEFSLTVGVGEILEIDTDAGTAAIGGVSKMSALTGSSVPVGDFVLASGTNTITYTTTSGGSAGADFLWRDART
ncbi:MAG: hypothetical protein ABR585_07835 [Gemmatimonadaceae bacterium]